MFIADTGNNRIRKIDRVTGTITTVAGSATACTTTTAACGDGGPATSASLNSPSDVAVGADGTLYIADTGSNRIRKVTPEGTISTVAGSGSACAAPTAQCGDSGIATIASLDAPFGVTVTPDGTLVHRRLGR